MRVAVTTGEALVRLGARPDAGEGHGLGDVVNTAARLQNAAPVERDPRRTRRPTGRRARDRIREAPAGRGKGEGRADPGLGGASARASRFGVDVAHERAAPLVGRERELDCCRERSTERGTSGAPQLVTLVGVPGIGKSRLVVRASRIVDADPELVTWRQGRCLAYGDGVTFWALGEIVKAQAGDPRAGRRRATRRTKLREAVADA